MPKGVVKTKRDEEKWNKAKQVAEKAGQKSNYAYIMGIYQKMKGDKIKKSLLIDKSTGKIFFKEK